jgi:hypothetical protein
MRIFSFHHIFFCCVYHIRRIIFLKFLSYAYIYLTRKLSSSVHIFTDVSWTNVHQLWRTNFNSYSLLIAQFRGQFVLHYLYSSKKSLFVLQQSWWTFVQRRLYDIHTHKDAIIPPVARFWGHLSRETPV